MAVLAPTKRLGDGRVVSADGEIWETPKGLEGALKAIGFDVCPKCGRDVLVAEAVLGGELRCDNGRAHLCPRGRRL